MSLGIDVMKYKDICNIALNKTPKGEICAGKLIDIESIDKFTKFTGDVLDNLLEYFYNHMGATSMCITIKDNGIDIDHAFRICDDFRWELEIYPNELNVIKNTEGEGVTEVGAGIRLTVKSKFDEKTWDEYFKQISNSGTLNISTISYVTVDHETRTFIISIFIPLDKFGMYLKQDYINDHSKYACSFNVIDENSEELSFLISVALVSNERFFDDEVLDAASVFDTTETKVETRLSVQGDVDSIRATKSLEDFNGSHERYHNYIKSVGEEKIKRMATWTTIFNSQYATSNFLPTFARYVEKKYPDLVVESSIPNVSDINVTYEILEEFLKTYNSTVEEFINKIEMMEPENESSSDEPVRGEVVEDSE